jgi:hypothetical protein
MGHPIRRTQAAPWLKDSLWRGALAVPSLDLRFADNKSLMDSVSGQNLITFSRASSATYIDSTGTLQTASTDVPRFDHNPTTGESLGLLVEEQRTNLLLQSENLGTTWTLSEATVSLNTAIAPDGQTTADTVIPSNGALGVPRQDVLLSDSTIYTFSVFFKTAGLNSVNLQFFNKTNTFHGSKNLDLSTGALSGSEYIGATSVVAYGNGWYRLILANLGSGTGATSPNVRIVPSTTGNGTSGFYIWGAQLEAGSFPTSYIPTTTAAATRAADVATITGTAFSSWYRQDEGTVFAAVYLPQLGKAARIIAVDDGNFVNMLDITTTGLDTMGIEAVASGSYGGGIISSNSFANANPKIAATYSSGANESACLNGGTVASGNITLPSTSLTTMRLGWQSNFANFLNGTIRRLTYFPARLPDTTLQRLTQ